MVPGAYVELLEESEGALEELEDEPLDELEENIACERSLLGVVIDAGDGRGVSFFAGASWLLGRRGLR